MKLVSVLVVGQYPKHVRDAFMLQLNGQSLTDACYVLHNMMSRPHLALEGGTNASELKVMQLVADSITPTSQRDLWSFVNSQCLFTVGIWASSQKQVCV